ncbi:MAG: chromosome segregation protein SMC [Phycisphaeraceae bacterium]|nr:chromosome segregation protein SMC [Phycisphaeraceae bacterium]
MRLAKLTLSGFKSFADTTEFTFDHPITGVVGPNGCGKSNIVDAIKWVLGERSSKSLRGTEMIDVIFAGSAGRKPSGMASVVLTFENPVIATPAAVLVEPSPAESSPAAQPPAEPTADAQATGEDAAAQPGAVPEEPGLVDATLRGKRALPFDSDVVEVERRLYRDGESAYLINGKKARLKDIRELFLDTGVGADAYSIIEQGKVDAMLLASPQERRTIFEEAAGIAKYKQRRIEAQRKLDRAQTNLKTAREELESTDRRLRLVRGQAAKARRFQELDSALRAWRLALAFEQYDDLERRILSLVGEHSRLGSERERAASELAHFETIKQETELRRHEAASRHRQIEQERLTAMHVEQQASQRRVMLERTIAETVRQMDADRERLGTIRERAHETDAGIERGRSQIAALSEVAAEAEARLAGSGEQRAKALEELSELRQASGQKSAAAARIDRERIGLVASIEADSKRADSVREAISRIVQKQSTLADDTGAARAELEASRAQSGTLAAETDTLEKQLEEAQRAMERLGESRAERGALVAKLDQDRVRIESRLSTLREMIEARAGFDESVREVLAAREAGSPDFAGVLGPLADMIEAHAGADTDAAAAVEAALGADLQGLVVRAVADLPGHEQARAIKGRVTFLPMRGMGDGQRGVVPSVEHADGLESALAALRVTDPSARVVSLRSLVRARGPWQDDADLSELLDRLLGRVYLVSDIDAAMLLGAGPMRGVGASFVTRDGAIVDARGRVYVGAGAAGGEGAGILRRRAEMESLETQAAQVGDELLRQRRVLEEVDAEAGSMSAQAADLRTRLAQRQRQLVQEQSRGERLEADLSRLTREAGTLEQESSQLRARLAKLEEDAAALRDRADSLARLYEEEHAAAVALEAQVRTAQMRADAAGEQMTAAKVEVGRVGEQLASARREVSRLEMARDDLARQMRDCEAAVVRLEGRIGEHQGGIDEALAQVAAAQADTVRLAAVADQAQREVGSLEELAAEQGRQVIEAREAYTAIERSWHALEVSKRELEVKRENTEERAGEELGLDLNAEYPEYREVMADGVIGRIDTNEAAREIEVLRDAVKKLGSVNIEAIDEEATLEQQNEDLVRQVADIDQACEQLTDLITKLNTVSRDLFGETFRLIQDNFGGEQGMFRKLFNGGKAEVRLMPLMKEVEDADGVVRKVETDEVDLLESGVEVIAKPPGKEPRSISQLSGGEKTLTAVALLLSIFRSKPSCFCVLDEVDAALDEGNVGRFNAVVREYTDRSSFIVITHNKRTMQTTDRLYGVTMQERGVSTRVSVRFDEVGKNGEIRVPARAGEAVPAALAGAEPPLVMAGAPPEAAMADAQPPVRKPRKPATLRPVKADPATLRRALDAMRELSDSPAEPGASNN